MLRKDINKLINDYGVKREAIINCLNSNRPTFSKKMKDNSFNDADRFLLYNKYGALLK